ncbi:MAG: Cu(I)-responsive transcriptional regulator [Cohaesibacteraceae bacterium]|nr:Cu(I)-responsive transcriptional regulator [Cohaesibacteraceae bacterium]PCH80235.1 MAG: Cu(I)-responsive transcriptional regulator [Hyphomicrobiales bacterium]
MNIGAAAELTSLPAKTIRYYEEIDLINPARGDNGYRHYNEQDVNLLRFVQRARSLGFSIEQCRNLLSLYSDKDRASADVKKLAEHKISEIDQKIEELQSLRTTLKNLADQCHGDHRPDCPILDGLAENNS